MEAGAIQRIESAVEQGATLLFAAAVAFATFSAARGAFPVMEAGASAALAGVAAFMLCSFAMRMAAGRPAPLPIAVFNVSDLEPFESDELLLGECDRLPGELLLSESDRIRGELLLTEADRVPAAAAVDSGDSRVVHLFAPAALKSQVDKHLARESSRKAPSDASQELAAALAELRRSLR